MNKFYAVLAVIASLFFFTPSVNAQVTTSQLTGKVVSAKGESLPGVTIIIVNTATGAKAGATTNADGRYIITNLNPGGPYNLSVTYVGYQKQDRPDLNLTLGGTTMNFTLNEESTALKELVVTGKSAPRGSGTKISQEQIRNLPSANRSLQDMTRTTPQSNNNSFLGTNFRYNNVTLDGAINNDAIGFSPSLGGQTNASGQPGSSTRTNPVSLDAVQDIQVLLAPYDVKIGNFLGGSINAVTRSGTNTFHGSVYGFGRTAGFIGKNNAGDGSKEPSDFHDYQAGIRLGFPIIKNKLFFFTNEEITRRVDPVILGAGSKDIGQLMTLADAQAITDHMKTAYGVDPGTYGNSSIYSNSNKFFNRVDWNINEKHQLAIRNNYIHSEATNLERDQQNFRFKGIDYVQTNNQNSTVAELKSRFNSVISNNLVLGYSDIHDYRTPTSNPALPQIQIAGPNGSGTIFLGTDREAAIFNMKQKTAEVTDNVTLFKGNHTWTIGTHNEFYNISYGFVNSWNGRVDYSSVADFLANNPNRVRGNYNYTDNTRDYIMANPPAKFKVNLFSLYGQDEIAMSNKFRLTLGLRFDYTDIPNKQPLSDKTTGAPVDQYYGNTFTYTKPKDIRNDFMNNVQVSPRVGFNYDIKGDQSAILRGGTGLFTGRIPFAWMGYAYYNNGVTYGAYDNKSSAKPFVPGTDPIRDAITDAGKGVIGEANFAAKQGVNVNDATGATQVDMIDNNFKMPQAWRSSLAFDYSTQDGWKFTVEGIYTKVIYDLKFQQVNVPDNPVYFNYDTKHQQPIWVNGGKINPKFTNAYLLSNTKEGYRYSITGQVQKSFPFGLNVMAAYTYGQAKDIANGIRNSMESNWQLNPALNPNDPGLAASNFDIRHRIVATANYKLDWSNKHKFVSNFTLFFNTASGLPYTYGFQNATVQNTAQQVSLAYIPKKGEEQLIVPDAAQAAAFSTFIDNDKYLKTRRGQFTERNGARTPWNTSLDFRFAQDFNIQAGKVKHTITLTYDIVNLTNLLNKSWGWQYFSPNTYNSTGSVGLVAQKTLVTTDGSGNTVYTPQYKWGQPLAPYSRDLFNSRYQMQLGLRYSF